MNLQLIHGKFSAQDAVNILTQLTNVKIKFHEDKIASTDGEESIKMREKRIKDLQKDLNAARDFILGNGDAITLESTIQLG